MLGYYVIMVATLGMTVTAGMTILASATAGERLAQASRDAQVLAQAETALRESLVYTPEGAVFAPLHDEDAGGLPEWVTSQRAAPSSGARLGYCPFAAQPAADADALTEITVPSSKKDSGYKVRIRERPARGGTVRPYVEKGARKGHDRDYGTAPEVVAFVLGPSRGSAEIPACDQVYWDGMTWQVDTSDGGPAGVVRAISRASIAVEAGAASTQIARRTIAREGTGDGTRRDSPGPLAAALAEWATARPARMTLELVPEDRGIDTYDLTQADLDLIGASDSAPLDESFGRSLHLGALEGTGAVRLRAVSPGGTALTSATLTVTTDLTARKIDFGTAIELRVRPGARVVLEDVTLRRLVLEGGEVVFRGTNTIGVTTSGAPRPIEARGGTITVPAGRVTLRTNAALSGAMLLDGAQMRVDGALNVEGAADVFSPDSEFMASYGTAGGVWLNGADVTEQSASRMKMNEVRGLTRQPLASQVCTARGLLSVCRKTAPCSGVLVEESCTATSDDLQLVSMRTLRDDDDKAYLECTWRSSAADTSTSSATASATCLPIRLDSTPVAPGG